jgi:hypothetical protein
VAISTTTLLNSSRHNGVTVAYGAVAIGQREPRAISVTNVRGVPWGCDVCVWLPISNNWGQNYGCFWLSVDDDNDGDDDGDDAGGGGDDDDYAYICFSMRTG